MEIGKRSCRICLSDSEFHISLFSNYCRRTNMIDKILVCLRIHIENNETIESICHHCAENVERYYEFINMVKIAQTKLGNNNKKNEEPRQNNFKVKCENDISGLHVNKRLITSYLREHVIDADYTFSFLETSNREKNEPNSSSSLFSFFSPQNINNNSTKRENENSLWKTLHQKVKGDTHHKEMQKKARKDMKSEKPKHLSRDLFDSQSQDVEEPEMISLDWKLTPDDNIIKRVREKCFKLSDF